MALTAILIDDEHTSLEILKYELSKLNTVIEVLGVYEDPVEGLKAVRFKKPDILFLDIEMPRLNGFDVLDLMEKDHDVKVIFVTAYNQYAVKAFKYYAIDYLVKPFSSAQLASAIDKVTISARHISSEEISDLADIVTNEIDSPKNIVVPISNGFQMIKIQDITKCEADNNYTKLHLTNQQVILVSKSLKHFEILLSTVGFLRVHHSHLVNMNYVDKYIKSDGGYIIMIDKSSVPVARSKKQSINDYFRRKSI